MENPIEQVEVKEEKSKGGRPYGSLGKSNLQVKERLQELDCDPVEFLAHVMAGKECKEPHPFLSILEQFINNINTIPDQIADKTEKERFIFLCARLYKDGLRLLYEGYVPIELRTKVGMELINYIHAKRKTIEFSDPNDDSAKDVTIILKKYDALFEEEKEEKLLPELEMEKK